MTPDTIPNHIGPNEELGRGVFSSGHAKRARRARTPHHVFLEREGEVSISVDRLSVAPPGAALVLAEKTATSRKASFYGWATVAVSKAEANGRRVVSSPMPEYDNPYHADIVLPAVAKDDREEQKRHAQELADYSNWLEKS
ncbi:MAG: hypothetical protein OXD38_04175 [Aestuariivita sp.]|nr:hypothetical protein [Gammaproteobacteria bacterium]MCY4201800.1 hypothetical protein [Aestuariivita sp.]